MVYPAGTRLVSKWGLAATIVSYRNGIYIVVNTVGSLYEQPRNSLHKWVSKNRVILPFDRYYEAI